MESILFICTMILQSTASYFQEFDVNGRYVMNGGVIYHEPGNDHSFSVCIDADEMTKPEWRIHT